MSAEAGMDGRDAVAREGVAAATEAGAVRTAMVVSADAGLRQRLGASLAAQRWRVLEAAGGAQAMEQMEARGVEAMLVDDWLPDLEVGEFAAHVRLLYPEMELLWMDGGVRGAAGSGDARSPRRNELLHALREAQDAGLGLKEARAGDARAQALAGATRRRPEAYRVRLDGSVTDGSVRRDGRVALAEVPGGAEGGLPELVGGSAAMREVARLVRMVTGRTTTVLIEGETGTGKELVARAVHRLSERAAKPLAVLNCAAIPEALLEAELFGHVRGAFTGAVGSRVGRMEAADGGTLLLDEIGEMPLAMQAKMLRFLESGEVQRVGENEAMRVDVRLIAATHQQLERRAAEGTFRLDLYHRLAVFPIEVPALRERMEDIAELAEHFLERMGRASPRKRLSAEASAKLLEHGWPGNVRELMHVLERGAILSGSSAVIAAADIRYRRAARD
jgi:DNA-binding NtrC family response regulator